MQVTQMIDGVRGTDIPRPTNEEMQHEYDYYLAERMTRSLLDARLITKGEFDKIMARNRESFSPFLARILR